MKNDQGLPFGYIIMVLAALEAVILPLIIHARHISQQALFAAGQLLASTTITLALWGELIAEILFCVYAGIRAIEVLVMLGPFRRHLNP